MDPTASGPSTRQAVVEVSSTAISAVTFEVVQRDDGVKEIGSFNKFREIFRLQDFVDNGHVSTRDLIDLRYSLDMSEKELKTTESEASVWRMDRLRRGISSRTLLNG